MNQHIPKLTCIKECVMPGIGQFAVGDVITDEILVEKLKDHPFFSDGTTIDEEK